VIGDSSGELHLLREPSAGACASAPASRRIPTASPGCCQLAETKVVQSEPLVESQRARLELVEPKDKARAGTAVELKTRKAACSASCSSEEDLEGVGDGIDRRPEADATGRYVWQATTPRRYSRWAIRCSR